MKTALSSKLTLTGLAAACSMLLAACGSTVKLEEPKAAETKPAPIANAGEGSTAGANAGNTGSGNVAPIATSNQDAGASVAKVIYFDFDSFVVKDEFKSVVEGNGKRLSTNGKKAAVEGHADERGSKEYNLALGQKRAEAVVKSLTLVGVKGDQLEAVSFGEEKPADAGHTEEAWSKNRRVELKDK